MTSTTLLVDETDYFFERILAPSARACPVASQTQTAVLRVCVHQAQSGSKAGVLGEASLNLAEFIGFSQLDQRALPLKSCSAGSVLHVS